MLPDFVKIKAKFEEIANSLRREFTTRGSVLRESPRTRIFEGNRGSFRFEEGDTLESPYKDISAEMRITKEEVIEKGFPVWVERLKGVADQMKQQEMQALLEETDRITEKTGNVVDGKGQQFSADLYLEMLEKVEIRFDAQGRPDMPHLICHPTNAESFKRSCDADPEFQKKFEAVLRKKKLQWDDQESRRILVD